MLQKGVFKKVYFGGPVGGGLPENKNPTKQCAGWEKNGKYKKSNQKMYFIYYTGYLAILKTTHLYRV
jgi:hypothetical protein